MPHLRKSPGRLPAILSLLLLILPYFLANISGESLPSRTRLAVRELVSRAQQGDPKAIYDLASLHDIGYDSIPVDSARSTSLYLLSAEKGYAPAQNYIGFRLYKGEGTPRDISGGIYWLEKAAVSGDAKAANNLGWILLQGEDVERDPEKTAFWFRKAAEGGLPAGQAQYADMLRTGYGVPADTLRADSLYCRAIEGGLRDAEAKLLAMQHRRWKSLSPSEALQLGLHHYTHRAPVIGVTLFDQVRRDTEGTIPDSLTSTRARALAMLGDAYTRAIGVDYDHDLAVECFAEAAALGNPSAQFIIGELLEIFPDALQDFISTNPSATLSPTHLPLPTDASSWLQKAAEAGVTDAATANRLLLSNSSSTSSTPASPSPSPTSSI